MTAVLVPVVTLVLGAAAAAGVFVALSGDEQPGPTVVAAETEDARIELAAEDYVGRQVDEAALALSALGLLVQRVEEVTGDVAPGIVTAVDPVGAQLRPGDAVRVLYAVAPEPAPRQRDSSPATRVSEDTGDDAQRPSRQPEPTEAATPTAPVEEELPAGTPPAPTSTPTAPGTTAEPEPTTSAPSGSGSSTPTTSSESTSSSSPSWDGEGDGDGDRGRDRSDG